MKARQIPSMKKMWGILAEEMCKAGFQVHAIQAENRWKTLERSYKKKEKTVKETGRGRIDFAFQR